jgi:hypothetical protein
MQFILPEDASAPGVKAHAIAACAWLMQYIEVTEPEDLASCMECLEIRVLTNPEAVRTQQEEGYPAPVQFQVGDSGGYLEDHFYDPATEAMTNSEAWLWDQKPTCPMPGCTQKVAFWAEGRERCLEHAWV